MALLAKCSMSLAVTKRPVLGSVPAVRRSARKLVVRASAEPTTSPANEYVQKAQVAANEAWTWMKTKWANTEDSEKPAVIAILTGVILAQIAIGATIDVVDRIPIVNTTLQLVGMGVTGYYIFKIITDADERDQVQGSVSEFLEKVTGKDK